MDRAPFGHIMALMQRQIALAALVGMAALIFAPELRDAGAFVLSKSLDANAIKVVQNSLYGLGCF
ncbi:MAG TPA: hypothetical protein DC046_01620 [Rhodospirillaceae bacterium]|nr:hypothetical protein [Rhodospirillaceae bacterium]